MKPEMKNILAIMGIILLIAGAVTMPFAFNKIVDGHTNSKIHYFDEEVYKINTASKTTVDTKIKTLGKRYTKNAESETVIEVPLYMNDTAENIVHKNILAEFKKWRAMINDTGLIILDQNINVWGENIKFNLGEKLKINDVRLYMIYNTDVSFYVCDGVAKGGNMDYNVKIYMDRDTNKIYLIRIGNDIINKMASAFAETIGYKWQVMKNNNAEQNITDFLKNYYGFLNSAVKNNKRYEGKYFSQIYELSWQIDLVEHMISVGFDDFYYWAENYVRDSTIISNE